MYSNCKSCIINNGCISPFFVLQRGIRQGCPLSSLLFLIVVEILAQAIRNDNDIEGFKVKKKTIKITQLADDMQVYIGRDKSLARVLNLIDEYGKYAGLKLNRDKTEGLKLGSW